MKIKNEFGSTQNETFLQSLRSSLKTFFITAFLLTSTLTFAQGESRWDTSSCKKCPDNPFVFDKKTIAKAK